MPWKLLCYITFCLFQVYKAIQKWDCCCVIPILYDLLLLHIKEDILKMLQWFFFLHIVKVSVWTTPFFKISAFMFHKRENIIQVWNDMRVHDNGVSIFGRKSWESEAVPQKKNKKQVCISLHRSNSTLLLLRRFRSTEINGESVFRD